MKPQLRRTVYAFLVASTFFGAALYAPVARPQQSGKTDRTLRKLPVERNEPVTITKIVVKDQSITTTGKFVGSDDWLSGLKITLKNSSDKPILLATIQLQFPRPYGDEGILVVHDIFYGKPGLMWRPVDANAKSVILAPGQSIDVHLSATEFNLISRLLTSNGYKGSIEEVAIRIGSTIFADDTMWNAGIYMQRNQNDPGSWIPVEVK